MESVSAQQFLLDQFPMRYRALVPSGLRTAHATVRAVVKSEPFLQIESAEDNRGRLVSWATDFAFERLIKTGQLPYEYRWRPFARPTGRYLEIRMSHSVMTISQVSDPTQQPRNVVFRENARLNNEPFLDFREFDDERLVHGVPHFLLIHGHQELNFAHIGLPHKDHSRGYIYRTPNLMKMPHLVLDDTPPAEDTEFDAAMELKAEIDKWRRDNGIE